MPKTITTSFFKLFIAFSLFAFSAVAQISTERFVHLTNEEGLSDNNVRVILQDSQGFIWIGTKDGLNRYDGYSFTYFRLNLNDENSLSDNYITALMEDAEGNIWIGTNNGGLNRYNPFTQQFTRYLNDPEKEGSLSENRVYCIFQDSKKRIWAGTKTGGLNLWQAETQTFKVFQNEKENPSSLQHNQIWDIAEDAKGNLWVGTGRGLDKLVEKEGNYSFEHYKNPKGVFVTNLISSIHIEPDGWIWFGSWGGGLSGFHPERNEWKVYQNQPDNPNSLAADVATDVTGDGKGNLWVTSYGGGLSRFTPETEQFTRFQADENNQRSLNDNSVWTIYRAKSGSLWLGTYFGGVNILDQENEHFGIIQKGETPQKGLLSNKVLGISGSAKDEIWIGTDQGVSRITQASTASPQFMGYQAGDKRGISSNTITTLYLGSDNTLWVGSWGGGMDKMTVEETRLIREKNYTFSKEEKNALASDQIISIYQGRDDHLWVGTFHGLSRLHLPTETFTTFQNIPENDSSLSDNYAFATLEDRQGRIWVGTNMGLNRKDQEADGFVRFFQDATKKGSLSHNKVISLFEDSRGKIWIGTEGGGLNLWQENMQTFKAYSEEDGLPSNVIQGICEDRNGFLWLTTNTGISQFDPEKGTFANFDASDGLQSDRFNTGALFMTEAGLIYAGGINGISVFDPASVKKNDFAPPVVITQFDLFNEPVEIRSETNPNSPLFQPIRFTKNITLNYDQSFFGFDFVALNFRNAQKNQYAFMMENYDKKWFYTDASRRYASYTNLPPGEYTFRVKASNNDGIWNDEGTKLHITITPPFWQTWWFRIVAAVVIIASVYGFYRYRVNRIKAANRELDRQVKERTSELNQANQTLQQKQEEVLTQNEELHQQAEEIAAQRDQIAEQNSSLSKALNNIRVLSEVGKQITATLEPKAMIKKVYENVNELLDASCFGIGIIDEEKQEIYFDGFMEKGQELPYHKHTFQEKEALAVRCALNSEEIFIGDLQEEAKKYFSEGLTAIEGEVPRSLIYLPLKLENRTLGVITVQSFKAYAYQKNEKDILDSLAAYIAIALDNASAYGKLNEAKVLIEEHNEQMTDSILYAKTIQNAILPLPEAFRQEFPESFIINRAKDIVSGDFFWHHKKDNRYYVAVVDCTGHGVPGAFMSLIGNKILNEIIEHYEVVQPAKVLEHLNAGIISALKQTQKANDDGMDLCMIMFEKREGKVVSATFAGAKRPLYYFHNGELVKLGGSRKGIGGLQIPGKKFVQEKLEIAPGDSFYLTSDGYVDQANADRAKLGTTRFLQTLEEIKTLPMTDQKARLIIELQNHQQDTRQRDDISLVGIRI